MTATVFKATIRRGCNTNEQKLDIAIYFDKHEGWLLGTTMTCPQLGGMPEERSSCTTFQNAKRRATRRLNKFIQEFDQ